MIYSQTSLFSWCSTSWYMGFTIICWWIGESVTILRYICQLLTRHLVSHLSSFLNISNSPQPLFVVDIVLSVDNLVKQGVLSLGPFSASNVHSCAKSSKGDTPLNCIFKTTKYNNTNFPHSCTFINYRQWCIQGQFILSKWTRGATTRSTYHKTTCS